MSMTFNLMLAAHVSVGLRQIEMNLKEEILHSSSNFIAYNTSSSSDMVQTNSVKFWSMLGDLLLLLNYT